MFMFMLMCVLQGKPAQAKGQDRLGGRSRIKVEEDNPYLYLSEVSDTHSTRTSS